MSLHYMQVHDRKSEYPFWVHCMSGTTSCFNVCSSSRSRQFFLSISRKYWQSALMSQSPRCKRSLTFNGGEDRPCRANRHECNLRHVLRGEEINNPYHPRMWPDLCYRHIESIRPRRRRIELDDGTKVPTIRNPSARSHFVPPLPKDQVYISPKGRAALRYGSVDQR